MDEPVNEVKFAVKSHSSGNIVHLLIELKLCTVKRDILYALQLSIELKGIVVDRQKFVFCINGRFGLYRNCQKTKH